MRKRRGNLTVAVNRALRRSWEGGASKGRGVIAMEDLLSSIDGDESANGSRREKASRFQHEADFVHEGAVADAIAGGHLSDADREKQRAEQLGRFQDDLAKSLDDVASTEAKMRQQAEDFKKLKEDIATTNREKEPIEAECKVHRRILDVLAHRETAVPALKADANEKAAEILQMNEEWEARRNALLEELRRLRHLILSKKSSAERRMETVASIRDDSQRLTAELAERTEEATKLQEDVASLPTDVPDRATYVRRIIDVVRNVSKQQEEIEKVLADVRSLRKEIATLSEQVTKAHAATEETIYTDAVQSSKKDPAKEAMKESLRGVVKMKDEFRKLVETIEETGRFRNAIRDVESQITALKAENSDLNTGQIEKDLETILQENETLKAKVAEISSLAAPSA